MFEGARLAHQPVDDMPVVDLMAVFAPQPRDPVHFRLTVQDPQTLTGKPDRHHLADQAARNRIRVVSRPDFQMPLPKGSFNKSICSVCGEYVFERYVRLQDGKPVCIPCSGYAG